MKPACACTGRIASAIKNASSSASKRRATEKTPVRRREVDDLGVFEDVNPEPEPGNRWVSHRGSHQLAGRDPWKIDLGLGSAIEVVREDVEPDVRDDLGYLGIGETSRANMLESLVGDRASSR